MKESFRIIGIVGTALIVSAYILLYTSISEIFVTKPRIPQPIRPIAPITRPTTKLQGKLAVIPPVKPVATPPVKPAQPVKSAVVPLAKPAALPKTKLPPNPAIKPAVKMGAVQPGKPAASQPGKPAAVSLPPSSAPKITGPATVEAIRESVKALFSSEEAEEARIAALRDPFDVAFSFVKVEETTVPGSPSAPQEFKKFLVLQGIFMSGNVKSAIIDDKVVYVGTKVAEGYKVDEIKTDVVILKKGGKIKKLRIKL